jgi:hypothetical protein
VRRRPPGVVALYDAGVALKQIADRYSISEYTVKQIVGPDHTRGKATLTGIRP